MSKETKKIPSGFIYFFGAFGGILFGYDIGVMTGALPFLQHDWNLTNASVIGWITSSLMLGAIFGGALAGQLSDKFGRRKMILVASFVFAFGAIMAGLSPHNAVAWLLFARVLLGLAVGAASALVPSYMSEMAPARSRGRLSGLNQLMIVSGMLLSYIMDFILKGLAHGLAWRLMLGLAAVPAIILFLGVLRLPESPRFLVKLGKPDEARQVLSYIRSDAEIQPELNEIQATVSKEASAAQNVNLGTLFSGKYRYLVTAGIGVAAFQQFMGANAIFYYIPLIVEKATGQAASEALLWPIVQGVILVLGAILYMVIAEKFQRKTLLILGGSMMALSFLMPAVLNLIFGADSFPPMLIVVFLSIFVAFYSFTWAPLTWVLVGELFPLAIRGRASGLASSFNWIGSFLVGLLFPIMTATMPQEMVFAVFGIISIIAVLFVKFRVPETFGRTLEEIESEGSNR
ncbi:sugar porter family MFS transporter [Weissella koreensis]|uniref:sugar porter family MFS transporter n=1 Tax=Weissella koreensis TaxID=165096 RepID=UPI0002174933|nr:sugar porter family MFS transporter [Weissella koreensis]AEJ23215.1 arabinose-proton symporter [Weissella koreensis KACC 15510]AVH74859.1 sugar porter family MFS transporter [Weissella koreensis]EJF33817.1 arabinose-proton symporter [Weissella koreensis KCTC 3621]MCZ9310720.1 sugar porter family MFS transporter [Weissella koreensis]